MADLVINHSLVLPTASTEYVDRAGLGGEVFNAGAFVYKDATTSTYKKAQCDGTTPYADAQCVGMAMNDVLVIGAPVVVAKGLITVGAATISASPMTVATQLNLSATAGSAAPVADLASASTLVRLAVVMTSTQLYVDPYAYGIQKP